jgi:predicted DNA-binding transcriptional regulator AlpA
VNCQSSTLDADELARQIANAGGWVMAFWTDRPALCRYFGVTDRTLRNWCEKRGFPKPYHVGRHRFDLCEVAEWMRRQRSA